MTTLDEALAGVLLNRFKALRKYMLRRMDDVGRDYVTDADVRLDLLTDEELLDYVTESAGSWKNLSIAAEMLGHVDDGHLGAALYTLRVTAKSSENANVREGALLGLRHLAFRGCAVEEIFREVAETDPDRVIRGVAREFLDGEDEDG